VSSRHLFRVEGKRISSLDKSVLERLMKPYGSVMLDIGTGDGKHAYRYAKTHPDSYVVGIDASAESLRAQSYRASRKPSRGGLPNVLFLKATVEDLPGYLPQPATRLHILLPWGKLLDQVLRPDDDFLRAVRAISGTSAKLRILLNDSALATRPGEIPTALETDTADCLFQRLKSVYERHNIAIERISTLTTTEARRVPTSWARRLASARAPEFLVIRACVNAPDI